MSTHHGVKSIRGFDSRKEVPTQDSARFQRMFPELPPLYTDPRLLVAMGQPGGPMDEGSDPGTGNMPAGFVFLGQFIDHDITLDVTSSLDRVNDPNATENFRTPALDLDCVYGDGPDASAHLYYHEDKTIPGGPVFEGASVLEGPTGEDLPRNSEQRALIGDPRNDENPVVSQLQLAFIKFHNAVARRLKAEGVPQGELFEQTRQAVRWHYQWIVLNDFLPRITGRRVIRDILSNGRRFYRPKAQAFIPIEFAGAAYRFGHTQVPGRIDYNAAHQNLDLFDPSLGAVFSENLAGPIDWRHFFGPQAAKARPLDIKLASTLLNLPFITSGETSLATRNLLRGQSFRLPSGQAVHDYMQHVLERKIREPQLPLFSGPAFHGLSPGVLRNATPLWFYVLAEGGLNQGRRLGPVGGRIVAEVLFGLLECDQTSFLATDRSWSPFLGAVPGRFRMSDLLKVAFEEAPDDDGDEGDDDEE